jgi:hypothetical protein
MKSAEQEKKTASYPTFMPCTKKFLRDPFAGSWSAKNLADSIHQNILRIFAKFNNILLFLYPFFGQQYVQYFLGLSNHLYLSFTVSFNWVDMTLRPRTLRPL